MMKMIHLAIYATLIISTSLILFLGYQFLWPVEVLKPIVQPYKVITKQVKQGGTLVYTVEACKLKNVSTLVVRRFVSERVVLYQPPESSNIRIGCLPVNIEVPVPKLASPGIWHLEIDVSYKVNPFRTKEYHLETEDFEIIPE